MGGANSVAKKCKSKNFLHWQLVRGILVCYYNTSKDMKINFTCDAQ